MVAKRGPGRPPGTGGPRLDYKNTRVGYIRALKTATHDRVRMYARRQHLPISDAMNRALEAGMAVLEQAEQSPR